MQDLEFVHNSFVNCFCKSLELFVIDTLDGGTGSGTTLFAGVITTLLCGLLSVFL